MTCSVFGCCSGARNAVASPPRPSGQRGAVLLLASSDVLHAIRSPHVNIVLIDVRSADQYAKDHIESAESCPCDHVFDKELILDSKAVSRIRGKMTPGALSTAFAAQKPTDDVGSCVVVYDSNGDTAEAVGPAAMLAELLVELEIVPEVGRLAGGFLAFKELKTAVTSLASAWEVHQHAGDRPDSASSTSSRLSRAMTPRSPIVGMGTEMQALDGMGYLESHASARAASGQRRRPFSAPKGAWKVSIDTEVPPARVLKGLYLGSKAHANNLETLRELGVSHVLIVSRDHTTPFAEEMVYCTCYVADSVNSDLTEFFDKAYNFIDSAREGSATNAVLVHCAGGVSRSTSLVASYLMRKQRISLKAALELIRRVHPAAAPNSAFIHQLMELEKKLGLGTPPLLALPEQIAPAYSQTCDSHGISTGVPLVGQPLSGGAVKGSKSKLSLEIGSSGGGGHGWPLSWQDYAAAPPTPQSKVRVCARAPRAGGAGMRACPCKGWNCRMCRVESGRVTCGARERRRAARECARGARTKSRYPPRARSATAQKGLVPLRFRPRSGYLTSGARRTVGQGQAVAQGGRLPYLWGPRPRILKRIARLLTRAGGVMWRQ